MADNTNNNYSSKKLIDHAKKLFPICRSITGQGIRQTLSYFEEFHPELERIIFNTGEMVFDWKIPEEWIIIDAYLEHIQTGKRFAEFKDSNLNIVGYSTPIKKVLNKKNIINKIHTLPNQPNLIPYVTSYYKKTWGFCMTHNQKEVLPEGQYKVFINSKFKKGNLHLSHALIKGKSNKEIFFSSYVCHPSMANNELSGPVVLNGIIDYLKKYKSPLKYSYRFVLLPETIGSIAYISRFEQKLKKNVICGFNLSCVGDERCYSFVQSPNKNTLADNALEASFVGIKNKKIYDFTERGSDERQYCSPNINLPLCTFSKSKFGTFPEYHTNADNFDLVTDKGLNESLELFKNIIDSFETSLNPKNLTKCEPQLSKRDLYPTISKKGSMEKEFKLRMNILAFSDGKNSIFDIAIKLNMPLKLVNKEVNLLKNANLLL